MKSSGNAAMAPALCLSAGMVAIFGYLASLRAGHVRRLTDGRMVQARLVSRGKNTKVRQRRLVYDTLDASGAPVSVDIPITAEMSVRTNYGPESQTVLVFHLPDKPKTPSVFSDGADSIYTDETGRIETRCPPSERSYLTLVWCGLATAIGLAAFIAILL